jgi:hypothetical protein
VTSEGSQLPRGAQGGGRGGLGTWGRPPSLLPRAGYPATGWLPCYRLVTLLQAGYPATGWLPCYRLVTLLQGSPVTLELPCSRYPFVGKFPRGGAFGTPSHLLKLGLGLPYTTEVVSSS